MPGLAGWTGTGGPWVKAEESMQHLVPVSVNAKGPAKFDQVLPKPKPQVSSYHRNQNDKMRKDLAEFYEDVIVKWQNPFRLEWYSYLYGIYLDMLMLRQKEKPDKRWFFNRYPAHVASRLIKK